MAKSFKEIMSETRATGLKDSKPARLVIQGLADETLWIISLSGDVAPNYQLMYAIGPGAFLNAFNTRLSVFQLGGIYVSKTCDNETDQDKEPAFLTFYKQRNIVIAGAKSTDDLGTPTRLTFNNITIVGWVVKLAIGEYSKEGIDGHTFQMAFLGQIDGIDQYYTAEAAQADVAVAVGTDVTADANSVLNAAVGQPEKRGEAVRPGTLQAVYPGASDNMREQYVISTPPLWAIEGGSAPDDFTTVLIGVEE